MFAGTYAPMDWSMCDGQIINIQQNTALYSLLGTAFGGDGINTFGLPDLRGRIPAHTGQGPGLTNRPFAGKFGTETETLTSINQIPHTHNLMANSNAAGANSTDPTGKVPGQGSGLSPYVATTTNQVNMNSGCVAASGAASPAAHDNMMPYLCINYIIAMAGIYPTRP